MTRAELLRQGRKIPSQIPVNTIVIVTADRPDQFNMCVESYAEAFTSFEKKPAIVIVDDSKRRFVTRSTLERLQSLNFEINLLGRPEKEQLVTEVIRAGVDEGVARFTLLGEFQSVQGTTVGANRNWALLATLGRRVVMVDDDTLCLSAEHPRRYSGVDLISHEEAREVVFFESREALRAAYEWRTCNILEEHQKVLGKQLSVISDCYPPVSLDRACDHLLAALENGRGTIAASMCGVAGDSGGYSGQWLLGAKGETRRRLWSGESTFNLAFRTREVFASAPCLTVTHALTCHGTTLGVANDQSLPPFLPIFANEDGFFGALMSLGTSEAFFAHLPFAIRHESTHGRKYEQPGIRASEVVIALMAYTGPPPLGGMMNACRVIGERLIQVSSLPDPDYWQVVHQAMLESTKIKFRMLEGTLGRRGQECPSYVWRKFDDYLHSASQQLLHPDKLIPEELCSQMNIEQAREATKRFTCHCGKMLLSWPTLVVWASQRQLLQDETLK